MGAAAVLVAVAILAGGRRHLRSVTPTAHSTAEGELAAAGGRGLSQVSIRVAQRFPRTSCSRSMAWNSALKLPLPKPSEPCRSMSSKNTVGRSPSGLVKICSR